MPANIARSHDELLRADSRFHFAPYNVGNRFVRVGVKRGANSRRIVDLEEGHLFTLDKRLDEHLPPYIGLPSTALTATASTSAFLDLITLASLG